MFSLNWELFIELSEHVIHGINEFLHGSGSFVAHVRDTESNALDFSISSVDQEIVFGFKDFDECLTLSVG